MATQAVILQRRDIESLRQAAGDVRAIAQFAAGDDHAAVIVVVLAQPEQELSPTTANVPTPAADSERVVGAPAASSRRSALARRRREVCKTQEGLARREKRSGPHDPKQSSTSSLTALRHVGPDQPRAHSLL